MQRILNIHHFAIGGDWNYGATYILYSPFSGRTTKKEFTKNTNIDLLHKYIKEGNVYAEDSSTAGVHTPNEEG